MRKLERIDKTMTSQNTSRTNRSEHKITIDGAEYNLSDLSDNAKNQIMNLRVTDQEIARLQQLVAIAQTARTAYAKALAEELPKIDAAEGSRH
ncbi:DUF6447 family protein [Desulfobacter postgatei]|jgi:flagellin-like hook-associated protein FlgL|uniref:DUF6447 family protein n=1 Tax=Desulfobacter postgatei TaxID=2293 RepID=UPI00259B6598|nr:DUF6447 family protein [uncultured Desulfobacter sp.]